MSGILVLAVLLGAAGLAAVGMALHRDLGRIGEELARSGHQPEVNSLLDQLWADVQQLYEGHVHATDKRLRDIELAITQVRQNQAELTKFVNWMTPLVRHWSKTTPEGS